MPIKPHTTLAKLRIKISNYRAIIRKRKRGVRRKNHHEWSVMTRNDPSTKKPNEIAVFNDEREALDFYQGHIKERLRSALGELRKLSPDDYYLNEK